MSTRWGWWLWVCLAVSGCSPVGQQVDSITLATTTSTRDSGLLDLLLPEFEQRHSVRVKVVAVGSGQALELGRRGDADVLLTHAPTAEREFMEQGWGILREPVMFNDFVLLGPAEDPAGIVGERSILTALGRIAATGSPFVSRGDQSGTHQREEELWREVGEEPSGAWYLRAGSGMAATLRLANEKTAYTLSDRATFLAQRDRFGLRIVLEGDPRLRNDYAVIVVNPERHPHAATEPARLLVRFLLSEATRARIANFGMERYGEPLFFIE
jgi:tungstate transport system substrate-binding protein